MKKKTEPVNRFAPPTGEEAAKMAKERGLPTQAQIENIADMFERESSFVYGDVTAEQLRTLGAVLDRLEWSEAGVLYDLGLARRELTRAREWAYAYVAANLKLHETIEKLRTQNTELLADIEQLRLWGELPQNEPVKMVIQYVRFNSVRPEDIEAMDPEQALEYMLALDEVGDEPSPEELEAFHANGAPCGGEIEYPRDRRGDAPAKREITGELYGWYIRADDVVIAVYDSADREVEFRVVVLDENIVNGPTIYDRLLLWVAPRGREDMTFRIHYANRSPEQDAGWYADSPRDRELFLAE